MSAALVQNDSQITAAPHWLLSFVLQLGLVLAMNKLALSHSEVCSGGESSLGRTPSRLSRGHTALIPH
ncbi:hypothetical protein PBY51_003482 [Eleginops maclovinus]|uniref:Uncharacterized protein n=1 Tax=Eleginops maclovinus TaxID=56733 RepID=A0AAN7Y352_ELEMC|nr:hypothetical protein PBY51_003482 [Eleginops maclovinus]